MALCNLMQSIEKAKSKFFNFGYQANFVHHDQLRSNFDQNFFYLLPPNLFITIFVNY